MIVKRGRDGLPEFLQREGATQRAAAVVLVSLEPPGTLVYKACATDRSFSTHSGASFEKAEVAHEQVDPYAARKAERLHWIVADENAMS
jgi:hypothetical protein